MSVDTTLEQFAEGQCWISDAELNLGIGLIRSVEFRHIQVFFSSCNEQRTYAKQTAPLTRLSFNIGNKVKSRLNQTIQITQINEKEGLFSYSGLTEDGQVLVLTEDQINPIIQFNRPAERLFNAQIDSSQWFSLRQLSYYHLNQLSNNDLLALTGSRTNLIAHQLYVAYNVANRYAPRVLLADEVGLGKTIEAGMILQHQLYMERVKRVLIVVPDSLIHQWLVEMLRRFNCHFSIFDEQRCFAEEQSSGMDNPFFTEQLVICSLDLLLQPNRMSQLLDAQWDMLIVDEAHHLKYSAKKASPQYQCIEQLAKITEAVLLLTATPEQLGKESHFARLRLLDPDRFHEFKTFIKEEALYKPIADLIDKLQAQSILSNESLLSALPEIEQINGEKLTQQQKQSFLSDDASIQQASREEIIDQLLDRHGTGRLLFRNTRSTVKGFPKRLQTAYALDLPEQYRDCYLAINNQNLKQTQLLLSPEALFQQIASELGSKQQSWTDFDPRIDWLADVVKNLRPQKILIIASFAQTAKQLNTILKQKYGIHSAVFHEGLNLLERDRAAAYFADMDSGCQVLVCSEIGSEGRNFQFSHQLVFFDLPLNPDLLEQRIGRLDRIGQTQDIKIHIPYFKNSAQQFIYQWFQQGLGLFKQICPAAQQIFSQFNPLLLDLLHQYDDSEQGNKIINEERDKFISTSHQQASQLNKKLTLGRDRLLELNSCRSRQANDLLNRAYKNDGGIQLQAYLDQVFDVLGVDSEPHRQDSFILHPGENMQLAITGLEEDGLTCTCHRDMALSNEDVQFLTWTHPLVIDVMGQILGSEMGNTSVITLKSSDLSIQLEPGSLLLESLFVVESLLEGSANIQQMFEVLLDSDGQQIPYHHMSKNLKDPNKTANIDRETIKRIIQAYKGELKSMIAMADTKAKEKAEGIINDIFNLKLEHLKQEKIRLQVLQKINPAVRAEEIDYFKAQIEILAQAKDQARHRLDAIRLIIIT